MDGPICNRRFCQRLPAHVAQYISAAYTDRLLNHGRKPSADAQSSATFALILAKYEFKKTYSVQQNLFSKELARELNHHRTKKMELWKEAVERVKRMSVRVVEVEHPHEQAVFEVYVHEKLGTPFNSFVNH